MRIYLLTVFLLTLCTAPLEAAEAPPRDIRALIILGLEKNIGLRVERINIPLSAEEIKIESAAFDPEFFASTEFKEESIPLSFSSLFSQFVSTKTDLLSGQMSLRKRFESGFAAAFSLRSERTTDNNSSDDLNPRYRTALLLDLTQPLLRNFGTGVNTTQLMLSRNQRQQRSYRYFLQAQSLALQVETLGLQLAGEVEIVKLRKEAVRLAQELYAANQRRFDLGVIPVSDVQQAETDLANRELNLSLALQSQELLLEQLDRELDHSLPANFSADTIYRANAVATARVEPDLPDFTPLFMAAKEKRLDLKISGLEIENSTLQKNFFKNQQQPQLDFKLQGGLNGLSGKSRNTVAPNRFDGNWEDSFSSALDVDGYQWQVGLEFSLPLGNRSAKARFQQAALQERQASLRKRDLESVLQQELLQKQTVLQRAAEQFSIARRFRSLAEKSFQQEQRRLEEGLSDTFRIILFQNNMINAKIDQITALTQYRRAVAQMNFSRGIILEQHGITVQADAEEANLETM